MPSLPPVPLPAPSLRPVFISAFVVYPFISPVFASLLSHFFACIMLLFLFSAISYLPGLLLGHIIGASSNRLWVRIALPVVLSVLNSLVGFTLLYMPMTFCRIVSGCLTRFFFELMLPSTVLALSYYAFARCREYSSPPPQNTPLPPDNLPILHPNSVKK